MFTDLEEIDDMFRGLSGCASPEILAKGGFSFIAGPDLAVARVKAWKTAHPAEHKAQAARAYARRAADPVAVANQAQHAKAWRINNPEKYREQCVRAIARAKDKRRKEPKVAATNAERAAKWRAANPEKYKAMYAKHNARLRENPEAYRVKYMAANAKARAKRLDREDARDRDVVHSALEVGRKADPGKPA